MKIFAKSVLVALLVVSLAAFLSACSSSSSSDSPSGGAVNSTITSTTQGAKSAAASTTAARTAAGTGAQLSGIGAAGGTATPGAAKIKVPFGKDKNAKMFAKFTKKFSPKMKKALALKASAQGFPIAISCNSNATGTVAPNSNNSMTIDMDTAGTTFTITWNNCVEFNSWTNGAMIMVGNDTTASFSIGTTAAPFEVKSYDRDISTSTAGAVLEYYDKTVTTMSWSGTATSDTMTADGYFESWDYLYDTHDKFTMTSYRIVDTYATSTRGSDIFDKYSETISGGGTIAAYSSATSTFFVSQSVTYNAPGFTLVYETPQSYTIAAANNYDYLSLDGSITVDSTPTEECIDGTFTIVTNTPVKTANENISSSIVAGQTVAGRLTINGNTVVVFNADGTVTVTVDSTSTTMSDAQFESVCEY